MAAVGRKLRSEREKRGLRLVDAAMATKVGAHHLSALEYGDYEALPDDRSVIGFVRVYAEHLGLDADAVAAEYAAELRAGRPAGAEESGPPRDEHVAPGREAPLVSSTAPEQPRPPDPRPPAEQSPGAEEDGIEVRRPRGFGHLSLPVIVALVLVLALLGSRWLGRGAEERTASPVSDPGWSAPTGDLAEQGPSTSEPPPVLPSAEDRGDDAEARPAAASGLTVAEHGVGTGIVDRRLVGEGSRFAEGQRVWFWTRVEGGTAGETIRHVWIHEGRQRASIELRLGGPHWRTQSRKTLSPGSTGDWAVEVRDEAGRVLARSEFVCEPRS